MRKGKLSMGKKKMFMAFAAVLSLVCGSFIRISAYADSDSTESRGNLILNGGELSIHASDMDYLQAEVEDLYGELPGVMGADASAAGKARMDGLRSKGIINYGNGAVVFNSADFYFLVNEIDELESEYKANVVNALKGIKTYFKPDGSIIHDDREETLLPQDAARLAFDTICQGIQQSQSVDHLSAAAAAENNISAGAAAWVNGQCIIGSGKDVQDAYDRGFEQGDSEGYLRGYADGMADAAPGEAHIEYTYHKHEGDGSTVGGCYAESRVRCTGRMAATDTGTPVSNGYSYNRRCDVCGYTDTSIGSSRPGIGQITGTCPQYKSTIVTNCGKTEETIESATIYYE